MDPVQPRAIERARRIILSPRREWSEIDAEPDTIGGIYSRYVLVLAALPAVAGLIGNVLIGYMAYGFVYRLPILTAVGIALSQYVMALIGVFVLALIIDALAPRFGGEQNRTQAVKVAAYANTASWVAGALTIVPQLAPIAALLSLYGLYLLYLGLPLLMRAPADKAIAYAVTVIVAAVVLAIIFSAVATPGGRLFAPLGAEQGQGLPLA